VFLAVVLRYSDLWDRVLNRKELTIYRIEAVLYQRLQKGMTEKP
jgi:hypothetical protein